MEVLRYSEWFLGYSGTIVARVFWVVSRVFLGCSE